MGHFARVYAGIVQEVLRGDSVEEMPSHAPGDWIQTSYNTRGGVHILGGTPLRKNYAGVGYIYDAERDAFYQPKPAAFPSFVLNEDSCLWEPPVPYPTPVGDEVYRWDEPTLAWVEYTPEP